MICLPSRVITASRDIPLDRLRQGGVRPAETRVEAGSGPFPQRHAAEVGGTAEVVLLRCNGPHGEYNDSFDPEHPHWDFHVHRASAEMIEAGQRTRKAGERNPGLRFL